LTHLWRACDPLWRAFVRRARDRRACPALEARVCLRTYRKPSTEVSLYQKPSADCCPDTETADHNCTDDVDDDATGQFASYNYSRTSCTDCHVTPYVTPQAQQPTSDDAIDVKWLDQTIRCSVCANVITSRPDGDVTAADNQSRPCDTGAPVHDSASVPV